MHKDESQRRELGARARVYRFGRRLPSGLDAPAVQDREASLIDLLGLDLVGELDLGSDSRPMGVALHQAREVVETRLQRRLGGLVSNRRDDPLTATLSGARDVAWLRREVPALDQVAAEVVAGFKLDLRMWQARVRRSRFALPPR